MSEENSNDALESEKENSANAVSKFLGMRQSNPKVFYGIIGGLVLLIIIILSLSGGGAKKLPVHQSANVQIGQQYTLKGVNNLGDTGANVRLVAVPGSLAAYDDTEKDDRIGGCKHIPQGTKVKAVQTQKAFNYTKFVEVEMLEGECKGQKGWVIEGNLAN